MQEYKLEILEPAWIELDEIADYHLLMIGPKSAKRITDQILKSLEKLKSFPFSGAQIQDAELKDLGYRIVISGEYICVYRLISDTVFVYHIVHSSRDYPRLFRL